jgi:proteasome lid subunit RPN8/RPN11
VGLTVTAAARDAIAAHAARTYPDECIGLLLGTSDGMNDIVAVDTVDVPNRWEGQMVLSEHDDPTSRRDRFYLDPGDYLRADREARTRGLDVVGCYHSHPDCPADPSERDRIGAQGIAGAGFAFAIARIDGTGTPGSGAMTDLRSSLLADDGSHFAPQPVSIVQEVSS